MSGKDLSGKNRFDNVFHLPVRRHHAAGEPHAEPAADSARRAQPAGDSARRAHVLKSARPAMSYLHWRADLKWLFGVPFTIILALFFAVVVLFQFSARDNAQAVITQMNQPVLSDPQLQAGIAAASPDLYQLINEPSFAAQVYGDPQLYTQKVDALIADPSIAREVTAGQVSAGDVKDAASLYSFPLRLASSRMHDTAGWLLLGLALGLVVTGVPFLLCSRRLGRLVSAGVSFAVASWPAMLLLGFLQGRLSDQVAASAGGGKPGLIAQDSLRVYIDGFFSRAAIDYHMFSLLGAMFLAAAGLAAFGLHYRPERREKATWREEMARMFRKPSWRNSQRG